MSPDPSAERVLFFVFHFPFVAFIATLLKKINFLLREPLLPPYGQSVTCGCDSGCDFSLRQDLFFSHSERSKDLELKFDPLSASVPLSRFSPLFNKSKRPLGTPFGSAPTGPQAQRSAGHSSLQEGRSFSRLPRAVRCPTPFASGDDWRAPERPPPRSTAFFFEHFPCRFVKNGFSPLERERDKVSSFLEDPSFFLIERGGEYILLYPFTPLRCGLAFFSRTPLSRKGVLYRFLVPRPRPRCSCFLLQKLRKYHSLTSFPSPSLRAALWNASVFPSEVETISPVFSLVPWLSYSTLTLP